MSRNKGRKQPARSSLSKNHSSQQSQVVLSHQSFQGPLPHPQILEEYERIHPGTAQAIIEQFTRETEHRHEIERQIVDSQINDQSSETKLFSRGQLFAFLITISALFGSVVCILLADTPQQAYAGAGIFGISLVSIITAFLGQRQKKDEPSKNQ